MFGYSREELMGMSPAALVGASADQLAALYDNIIAGRVDNAPVRSAIHAQGRHSFQGEIRRHAQLAGTDWTIVGLVRDVTEEKERADELRRFRAAMEISGDGIGLVDRASMRYVDVNQTLCDLLGYTRTEMLGKTPMDLLGTPRKDLESDFDAIIADKDGQPSRLDGHFFHKDWRAGSDRSPPPGASHRQRLDHRRHRPRPQRAQEGGEELPGAARVRARCDGARQPGGARSSSSNAQTGDALRLDLRGAARPEDGRPLTAEDAVHAAPRNEARRLEISRGSELGAAGDRRGNARDELDPQHHRAQGRGRPDQSPEPRLRRC
jgi:PAS domain-containing protein